MQAGEVEIPAMAAEAGRETRQGAESDEESDGCSYLGTFKYKSLVNDRNGRLVQSDGFVTLGEEKVNT